MEKSMVMTWLIFSMKPEIGRRYMRKDTAKDILDNVAKTFKHVGDFAKPSDGSQHNWAALLPQTIATPSLTQSDTLAFALHAFTSATSSSWVIDSGTTDHMTEMKLNFLTAPFFLSMARVKVLANKLQLVVDSLVSDNQSCFIASRKKKHPGVLLHIVFVEPMKELLVPRASFFFCLILQVDDANLPFFLTLLYILCLFNSVIVEALKVDSLQRLCSSFEPLFRRIVSEEVERALAKLGHAKLVGRPSPQTIQGPEGRKLQLHFKSRLPPHLFTGGKVEGEHGAAIHAVLLDANTGSVVQVGAESAAKLDVVVLEGDFNDEVDDDWTEEHFESHQVKEREGKRPLLNGDLQVTLREGVGTLGELTFTDNSSWIRSRKFRLGIKVAPGYCDGIRVREAKSEAFSVKDHRGELYKKHYPPALHDEVWRLDRIAKDGALHKKLTKAEIFTVEDFLRLLVRDPQKLRSILGSGMSNRMWENTVEHAKTCGLGGKLYVYYADGTRSSGAIFNNIYELRGVIADGQFLSVESLSQSQKVSVDLLVKRAYDNWIHTVEYDGKVLLNSLNSGRVAELPAVPRVDHNPVTDHYYLPQTCTQNYFSPAEGTHFHTKNNLTTVHQQIDFPFTRLDPAVGLALTTPQVSFPGSTDYQSGGTSAVVDPYVSGDWSRPRETQGLEDIFSEEIRLRSSEMLANHDMQRLLKTFNMGGGDGLGTTFGLSDEACYSYKPSYEPQTDCKFGQNISRNSGKAVVGWLKLKAALRWGIFVRKRAAEKRAQLIELE
ncbi:calmodulin-binding protein 60 E-like [Telopea speciosissima]|uniref:calmodulin-binding protein 60 E-like n=1 Tax=Telopea speciosissima TaxID=54955 RepID=UPI001CC497EE|nr:calmodulin-binding protein 60 E-like [Telopea speciosissima]